LKGWRQRSSSKESFSYETTSLPYWTVLGMKDDVPKSVRPMWSVRVRDHTHDKEIYKQSFANRETAERYARIYMRKWKRG
jgi:hypothetical protein